VGVLGVLNVRDEPLLLCVSPNYLEGHGFAWLECSYLRWRFHAVDRHENAAALNVEEYPKRGSEMHHAFDRNEILEIVLEHRAGFVASLLRGRLFSIGMTFEWSSGKHENTAWNGYPPAAVLPCPCATNGPARVSTDTGDPVRTLRPKVFTVMATWDADAGVWVATSQDVPGLATEAETVEILEQKLKVMIPSSSRRTASTWTRLSLRSR
jgi:Domain of unknown function (DUF1902)